MVFIDHSAEGMEAIALMRCRTGFGKRGRGTRQRAPTQPMRPPQVRRRCSRLPSSFRWRCLARRYEASLVFDTDYTRIKAGISRTGTTHFARSVFDASFRVIPA